MKKNTTNTRRFGIVQGRLTVPPQGQLQWFPQDSWRDEFSKAEQVGISFIELLTERSYNQFNPVWSEEGRAEIKSLCQRNNRLLYSICTDYIIDHPLSDESSNETITHVQRFLDVTADLGCKVAVFPLLEASDLTLDTVERFVPVIKNFARQVAQTGMIICIESLLNGKNLREFLERVDEPNVKCVFDTGNRVVDCPDLASEIRSLREWISHVHIKDKNANRENVLLGTGLVNFSSVFEALAEINYQGPLVFETTRGADPLETARYHMAVCEFFSREAQRCEIA